MTPPAGPDSMVRTAWVWASSVVISPPLACMIISWRTPIPANASSRFETYPETTGPM